MGCWCCCCALFSLYVVLTFGCFALLFVVLPFDFVGLHLCGFGLIVVLFAYADLLL